MEPNQTINCAVECVNGCKLGDQCPGKPHLQEASKFIAETSLDQMLAMAEAAAQRKREQYVYEEPKWVFPDDGIQPD
jgi:hypothetical protein